jgi:hypothetical protein
MAGGTGIVSYDASGNLFASNDSIFNRELIAYLNDKLVVVNPSGSNSGYGAKMVLLKIFSSDLRLESSIEAIDHGTTDVFLTANDGSTAIMYLPGGMISNNGNTIIVKQTKNDTVFHYKNGRVLEPEYRLDLGSHTIPLGAFGSNPTVSWRENFYHFRKILEGERYIIAEAVSMVYGSNTYANLILDKRNHSGGFSATGPDGKSGLFLDDIAFIPCYIRDNRLVGYMQALDIVDNAESIINPELKALAATLKEDSNPVIVVAKLKK